MADFSTPPGTEPEDKATIPIVRPQVNNPLPPRKLGTGTLSLRASGATNFAQALGRTFQKHMIRDATASLAEIGGSPFTSRSIMMLGNNIIETIDREWTKMDFDHFKTKIAPYAEQLQESMNQYNQIMVPRLAPDGQTYIVGPPGGELPISDPRSLDFLRQASAGVQTSVNDATSKIMDVASTDFIHNPEVEKFARSLADSYVESMDDLMNTRKDSIKEQAGWMEMQGANTTQQLNQDKLEQSKFATAHMDEEFDMKKQLHAQNLALKAAQINASNAAATNSLRGTKGKRVGLDEFVDEETGDIDVWTLVNKYKASSGFSTALQLEADRVFTEKKRRLNQQITDEKLPLLKREAAQKELNELTSGTLDNDLKGQDVSEISAKVVKDHLIGALTSLAAKNNIRLSPKKAARLAEYRLHAIGEKTGLSDLLADADERLKNKRPRIPKLQDASAEAVADTAIQLDELVDINPAAAGALLKELDLDKTVKVEELEKITDQNNRRAYIMDVFHSTAKLDVLQEKLATNPALRAQHEQLVQRGLHLKKVIDEASANPKRIPVRAEPGGDINLARMRWLRTIQDERVQINESASALEAAIIAGEKDGR